MTERERMTERESERRPVRHGEIMLARYWNSGDRGSTVVRVLCYKSEGR